ncbi:glycosyltransferase [Opitutales bacterium]|nr:glycosyltransferase [Opitutales bacterium]
MKLKKQVLVITNYRPDQQQSMLRFGDLLTSKKNAHPNLDIKEIYPTPVFRKICPIGKLRKWAAYLDKYLLFPKRLKRELKSRKDPLHLIHIIDHSNATYLPKLSRITQAKKIITCHDLIAIRTAKGEFAQAQKTSKSGRRLQNWIADSLHHVDYYACDSRQTLEELNELIPLSKEKSSVLHLGTELYSSTTSEKKDLSKILHFDPLTTNFLLHVGSAAWYKNRKAVFRSFIHAHTCLPVPNLRLVLVGPKPQKEELDDQLTNWIKSNPSAIHSLQNLTENTLDTLYKSAKALVFPSFIEGFGWPPLEAAVRGCPVITTRTGAIADLLGNYANYVEAENQASIDQGVLQALQAARSNHRAISLPSHADCRRQYSNLYEQLIAN